MIDSKKIISDFEKLLEDKSYCYVVKDPERAIGLESIIPDFSCVFYDDSHFKDYFKTKDIDYFCLQDHRVINRASAAKLLKSNRAQDFLLDKDLIQTFKISSRFENLLSEEKQLLNTTSYLNKLFEDKISQYQELSSILNIFPDTVISALAETDYQELSNRLGATFILQFGRGHTGLSTFFIENETNYNELKQKFPLRMARMSKLIKGETYTVNCCVTKYGTYLGGLSFQLTGDEELAHAPGATIGNDFSYRGLLKDKHVKLLIDEISKAGSYMYTKGYKGLFGVDFMVGEDDNLYFIEINARQPASIPFHTKIQLKQNQVPLQLLHISSFLDAEPKIHPLEYSSEACSPLPYSQVFIRAKQEGAVANQVKTGAYRLQGDNAGKDPISDKVHPTTLFLDEERDKSLIFQNQANTIEQVDSGKVLLLSSKQNKQLKVGEEISRLQLSQQALDDDGKLKRWIVESLVAIKKYCL